jgi:hypothetical protein
MQDWWKYQKPEPTRTVSFTLPAWLADELDHSVYLAKSKGSKITKSAVATEALKQFLHIDHLLPSNLPVSSDSDH